MKTNFIYKVRYQNGNENAYETFKAALAEYKNFKDSEGGWKAVELYRLDCEQGLCKTMRGNAPTDEEFYKMCDELCHGVTYNNEEEAEEETQEEETTYTTNYKKAAYWCNNSYVMCNNIPNIDNSIYENARFDIFGIEDIFQWFVSDCSESDVDYLSTAFPGLLFTYSDLLECFVLCVDHWGTSWDYVTTETTNPNAAAALGE